MSRLLIGETQPDLAAALQEFFLLRDFKVRIETHGMTILSLLREEEFDIILLEIALHGINSIEVTRDYRASGGTTPILLMTSKHSSSELQVALNSGADGYIEKPFQLIDLGARVRALLRRPHMRRETVLVSGDIALDAEAGTVTKNDAPVHLHPMEFKLLQFLLRHPNQVFSSHALFERVWQKTENLEDTVRTHVRTLRKKLDSEGEDSIIQTVRGFGYKVRNP